MNNRHNKNDIASRISHTSFARLHRRLEAEYYVILLLKKKMNLHGKKKEEGEKKKQGTADVNGMALHRSLHYSLTDLTRWLSSFVSRRKFHD